MTVVFYANQVDYIPQLNALWDRATVSVFGTSTTSLSISTGSKSFTTNPNLQFAVGSQVTITATADLSKYMSGQISSYDQSTGATNINISSVNGSGTFSSWSITLTGAAGATGAAGIADNISIGTVTSGGTAAASITGTSPNKLLNLTLQKGDTGATGASNVLSIGTVTGGATASATITGTSPTQTLNLVLPKGDTGATGDTGAKGLNAQGVWNSATNYVVDDWVTHLGSSYYRKIAGTTATDPATDTTNWGVLAQKGADGSGAVSSVTASTPLASSGGSTPNITIQIANTTQGGYLSNTDWNTFNGKANLISPSFTTPTLDVATATSINRVAITAPATSATITIANGKTFTSSNTLTFTGTDGSTLNIGTGGTLGTAAYTASTAYAPAAGSVSVVTLGAVSTGTWNATVIAGQYGGTGVNNSGKTITLGGNLNTSGAFASTFTMTATTVVTFPASGTLLSTAAAVTVAQGGTGLSTLTSGNVLIGNGTSSPTLVAPSTSGNVLTSNGTTWVSSPAAGGSSGLEIITRTSNIALSVSENGKFIDAISGTFTQTLNAGITLGTNWWCWYRASSTGVITIDPNGSETIDGVTSGIAPKGAILLIQWNGTSFNCIKVGGTTVTEYITGGTSWICPLGIKKILRIRGCGGGAGCDVSNSRTVGSAGGYFEGSYDVTASGTYTLQIGAAGSTTSPCTGGTTIWNSVFTGNGGTTSSNIDVAGGSASGASINLTGGAGFATSGSNVIRTGGSNPLGTGSISSTNVGDIQIRSGYGAGASSNITSQTGTQGVIILEY